MKGAKQTQGNKTRVAKSKPGPRPPEGPPLIVIKEGARYDPQKR